MDKEMGLRIKKARISKGLTQKDAGEKIGSSESTFSRYESGHVENIPLSKIESIAKLFDVSPGYLMGWEDMEEPEINTIAAHALEDLTEEEQEKVLEYAKLIKAARKNNGK